MDVSVALRRVENLLRDTLQNILSASMGGDWIEKCGVSSSRLERWKERAAEELRVRGSVDPRLLYYADFYELRTILRKNWDKGLIEVFGDLKETQALLGILEEFRNPEAHRREFLPFEERLVDGITGRIRSKIIRHYSLMETSESYYPRFEFAQDSLGNTYSIGQGKVLASKSRLRPGDEVQFKLVGSDPLGEELEYLVYPNATTAVANRKSFEWSCKGEFSFPVLEEYVGKTFSFIAVVRSTRTYHAQSNVAAGRVDDELHFRYEVLPPRSDC